MNFNQLIQALEALGYKKPIKNDKFFGAGAVSFVESVWGRITGNIADQTDLKNVLDAKADVTHDHDTDYLKLDCSNDPLTGNLDLGNNSLNNVNSVQFDITPDTLPVSEGLLQWNPTDGTLNLGMSGGDITQQIGQELFVKVRNDTGQTIENGKPVYISGRLGNRPKILLAKSDSESTSKVFGITTQDILDKEDGYVTTFGYVRQIKTNYSGSGIWGTTWAEGDNLYVSKSVAGQLTNVEPDTPHHSDIVGQVAVVGNVGIGSIFVNIDRHKTVDELSDVDGTPLTVTGQLLVWNQESGYWDASYNINNYLKLDASNDPVTGNLLIKPSVDSLSGFEVQDKDANVVLSVDTINNRVGIGVNTPSYALSLLKEVANSIGIERSTTASTAGAALTIRAGGGTSGGTDLAGGDLNLFSGISTGGGTSNIYFKTYGAYTGTIKTVTLSTGGSGYTALDVVTLTPGGANATVRVDTVDGTGKIVTFTLISGGSAYTIANSQPVTGGTGTGAKFNVTALTGTSDNTQHTNLIIGGTGRIGAGANATLPVSSWFSISNILNTEGGDKTNLHVFTVCNLASLGAGTYSQVDQLICSHASGTVGFAQALKTSVTNSGAGTVSTAIGNWGVIENSGAGVITTGRALETYILSGNAAGTIGTAYHLNVKSTVRTGAVTNIYGLNIETQTADTTCYGVNIAALNATNGGAYGLLISNITGSSAANSLAIRTYKGNIIFNEGGDATTDVRIEGDTDANLFFTDASVDMVGIGTSTPAQKLDVNGIIFARDKVIFTQTDTNEYIDSEADGYLTVGATNSVLINSLNYGAMYGDDVSITVTIGASSTYYAVGAGLSSGLVNGFTFANSTLTCAVAGKYKIDWGGTIYSATANQKISMAIMVNSTAKPETEGSTKLTSVNDEKAVAGSGIISLAVNDVVKFCVENETGANDIVVTHATLSLVRIGL